MKVNSLIISDCHVFSKHCQIHKILEVLKKYEFDTLILNGDFLDLWSLKRKFYWIPEYNVLFQKILRLSRKGVKVYYVAGNHDQDILNYLDGDNFGGISICEEYLHIGVNKTILVQHGHKYDGAIDCPEWLQKSGSVLYDWSIDIGYYLNKLLALFGRKWSLANFLKQNAKEAIKYINKYELAVVNEARRAGVTNICVGHSHRPIISRFDDINYYNSGDFVESCSFLIEKLDGEIELVYC